MPVTPGTPITQAQMDALASLANSKLGTSYAFDPAGGWFAALGQLWGGVARACLTPDDVRENLQKFAVSGPWVINPINHASGDVNGVDLYQGRNVVSGGFSSPFKNLKIYFAGTDAPGPQLAVTETGGAPRPFNETFNGDFANDTNFTAHLFVDTPGANVQIDGTFRFTCSFSTTPTVSFPSFTTDLPGVTWTQNTPAGAFSGEITGETHTSISAGTYVFNVKCNAGATFQAGAASQWSVDIRRFSDAPVKANGEGIHGWSDIYRLDCPSQGDQYGIWFPKLVGGSPTWPTALFHDGGASIHTTDIFPVLCKGITKPAVHPVTSVLENGFLSIDPRVAVNGTNPCPPYALTAIADVTWNNTVIGGQQSGLNLFAGAVTFRPPQYPVISVNEDAPAFPQWNPWGWQIYAIRAYTSGTNIGGGILSYGTATQDIPVSIGYRRLDHGGAIQNLTSIVIESGSRASDTLYPCWPIFTPTPLVYDSGTHKVNVSAFSLTQFWDAPWPDMSFPPIMANWYNDIEAALNLL